MTAQWLGEHRVTLAWGIAVAAYLILIYWGWARDKIRDRRARNDARRGVGLRLPCDGPGSEGSQR